MLTPEKRMHFAFDTNILWKICKSDIAYHAWSQGMASHRLTPEDGIWGTVPRPFLFIETLGIKPGFPNITLPASFCGMDADPESIKRHLYTQALAHYKALPALSAKSLAKEYYSQRERATLAGQRLLDDFFLRVVKTKGFEVPIQSHIAMNFVNAYIVPEQIKGRFRNSIEVDIFRSLGEHRNINQTRVLELSWDYWIPTLIKRGLMTLETVERISKSLELKKARDLGDTDIVHLPVLGFSQDNVVHPVTVFTADPPQKIKDRIYVFKTLAAVIYDKLAEIAKLNPAPFPLLQPVHGNVVLCDKDTGAISEVVDVETWNG